jgi:processive 1,2-diacylglycerol beta-glucosyltransferase
LSPRRILILSASVGAGHLRAAEAVEKACRLLHPDAEVRHVDVLDLTPPLFRKLYGHGYLALVNRAPALLGILYDRSNRPPAGRAGDAIRLAIDRLNTRPFVSFLEDFRPDAVCHTHFLPAGIVGHLKARGRLRFPQAVVVTDFDVHRFWVCPRVDRLFVARDENRTHLKALGVRPDRVRVTGIPVDPVFSGRPDLKALRAKHGIDSKRPLLLVLCGGFGVGPVEAILDRLWGSLTAAQAVVVTGRNESLRIRLARRVRRAPFPTRVLGFTGEMHEWMALASLLITKPGGLTTSEALACGLPMVVVNPIPGQETRNAVMLYERGAAISGENPYTLGARIADLLASPDRLAALRRAARRLGRPRAAFEVAEELGRL